MTDAEDEPYNSELRVDLDYYSEKSVGMDIDEGYIPMSVQVKLFALSSPIVLRKEV